MSIFNEYLPKIIEISRKTAKAFDDELKAALASLDKLEADFKNGRGKTNKDKPRLTTLQSIHEDDGESTKTPENENKTQSHDKKPRNQDNKPSSQEKKALIDNQKAVEHEEIMYKKCDNTTTKNGKRLSKKRSKEEVEGMSSPEADKRQKRSASVKAQNNISKQDQEVLQAINENPQPVVVLTRMVNLTLNHKMRREDSDVRTSRQRKKIENKENSEPVLPMTVRIKQEKISIVPDPSNKPTATLPVNIAIKTELNKDDISMPPPAAPVPRPRRAVRKQKSDESSEDESSGKRRTTRTRKHTDASDDMPPPPLPVARSTRARQPESDSAPEDMAPPASRPKRTRTKKNAPDETKNETIQESLPGSPVDKPRPKRTKRGQKAAEDAEKQPEESISSEKPTQPEETTQPEDELSTQTLKGSKTKANKLTKQSSKEKKLKKVNSKETDSSEENNSEKDRISNEADKDINLEETRIIAKMSLNNEVDRTIVLTNGVFEHVPVTPQSVNDCNITRVLARDRESSILDKPHINDATVVIDKDPKATNVTDDNSLLTDDNSDLEKTPNKPVNNQQPTSAVKEKVQQFEELAARTTRTKTRAMAKKQEEEDTQTPPDKIKPAFSAETLAAMNNMIFNGKAAQASSSASKPRVPAPPLKSTASASKLTAMSRHRELADVEDARKKKEAMLEAKKELHKKRREEKMAAAAAAREAAERERRAAIEAAAKEKMEKQAHVDQGKLERLREVEKKKLDVARRVAEMDERRKAEEQARQQRLAEEQKRAEAARKKQLEEAEVQKREAAMMKEIEKKQREYIERQKMKHTDKSYTPLKSGRIQMEPVYMMDGFQYLNSDEDEEPAPRPQPAWSTSKSRKLALYVQSQVDPQLIDKLFGVKEHSPDLREIFPNIERNRLKRTSSAVWRTPPRLLPIVEGRY